MSKASQWHDEVWTERYGHICPPKKGEIVHIEGLPGKDTYNPALYEFNTTKILAFRTEKRDTTPDQPSNYHPTINFARPHAGGWKLDPYIEHFDMMEDPFFTYVEEKGVQKVIFGGVRVRNIHGELIPQTEFYKGDTLEDLEYISFAVIHNMKDVRVLQLPDGRFLLCRRPRGDKYERGRIVLHIIDSLDILPDIDKLKLPVIAVLDSGQNALDWVGVNEVRILKDSQGHAWVGLLGHVALEDHEGNIHYAACTYKISLEALLDKNVHKILPQIIATRSCFQTGPSKTDKIRDVIFPGHLEHIKDYTYRLWAGLSDTRIGALEIDDPFKLRDIEK
ncbi:MAG TPA: DUF1861 family protein [Patescibacteria group bacterium]|nr:DUF1861 family protein [Patescibacteria group bacterium]